MSTIAGMPEIDLIPADYRNERALSRTVRTVGIAVVALVCVAAALSGGLRNAAAGARAEAQRLDAAAAMANLQRTTIDALALRKGALEAELSLLEGLRRGVALEDLLGTVAGAAPAGSVWFLTWQFERLGAVVAAAPVGAEGFFVIEDSAGAQEAPAVRVQMTIAGQARDHAAVSAFVSGLQAQAGIRDVRVQRASRENIDGVVDFDLLVVADSQRAIE